MNATWTRIQNEFNLHFSTRWYIHSQTHPNTQIHTKITTTTLNRKNQAEANLRTKTNVGSSNEQIFQFFYRVILNVDMKGSGVLERASLPSKIRDKEKYQLKGRWMLQIESITNVGVGMEQRKEDHKNAEKDQRKMVIDLVDAEEEFSSSDEYDEIEDRGKREYSKRMLKICLSDGKQKVWGIEYQNIPDLNIAIVGQKVFVSNVHVRHGLLLLTSQNTQVLGGTIFIPKRKEDDDETSTKNNGDDSDGFFSDEDFLDDFELDV